MLSRPWDRVWKDLPESVKSRDRFELFNCPLLCECDESQQFVPFAGSEQFLPLSQIQHSPIETGIEFAVRDAPQRANARLNG